jgi:hypothetical protein
MGVSEVQHAADLVCRAFLPGVELNNVQQFLPGACIPQRVKRTSTDNSSGQDAQADEDPRLAGNFEGYHPAHTSESVGLPLITDGATCKLLRRRSRLQVAPSSP